MNSIPSFISERNVILKDQGKTFGLIYPAKYDIGMGGMTAITLANLINSLPNWRLERVFLPWNPFIEPISMEHGFSLSQMDMLGFTSQFEPDYLVVGWMLKKAGIPLDNLTRKNHKGKYPPVFVGGPCAGANPFPLLDLVDGYFLGDAEHSLPHFLQMIEEKGIKEFWYNPSEFNEIKGFWTPHALESKEKPYSYLFHNKTFEEVAGSWYNRFEFVDLDTSPYPLKQIYCTLPDYHPYAPVKGQTFQLEIGRGCSHGCRFCMIGSGMFSPARYRSLERLLEIVEEGITLTGVSEVDIFGPNLSDFPKLTDLCWELVNKGLELSMATLRPDKIHSDLIEAISKGKQTSLTLAPETGSDRLRYAVCKRITNEQILDATTLIFEAGISTLKDFFLIGLPTETEEDQLAIIDLVKQQLQIANNSKIKSPLIRVDMNPMVPKWQTPLKNWVYHFLPENRVHLREALDKIYMELSKEDHFRPKQVSVNEFLAQTWITHLEEPINFYLESIPLESHIPTSKNGAFYLFNYQERLDPILKAVWYQFKKSGWQIEHRIRATNHSDKEFIRQYKLLTH
jgi:radical SAM superfamily enzyme YgiQ (UPF0313 family)